ncbi:Neocarzinostatin family protein [Amycolatopsis arida]|uniref:Neocarzinostatin family protein n=1 Tax=Amycolatopsis arida TaxID=587909 RepID=A0A1I5P2T2_9PSEU|nr:enediyne antibiotic chromoprotein [Amycolatopsis arida]TDX98334.1 neocarzinostatin family protein [Amycolatopsis arida]SFP28352.1 Neocarzinostatin family protein [Amycolatopsis arida]
MGSNTRLRKAAAVVAIGAGMTLAGMAPAMAAAATVSADPNTGLAPGQTITVSGSGFAAGSTLRVAECGVGDAGLGSCNAADASQVTTDGNGAFTTQLTLRMTFDGVDGNGNPGGAVDCSKEECFVVAVDTESTAATTPISFG